MPTSEFPDRRRPGVDLGPWREFGDDAPPSDRTLTVAEIRSWAIRCRRYLKATRTWGRDVFAGRVALDEEFERNWLDNARRVISQDLQRWEAGLVQIRHGLEDDAGKHLEAEASLEAALRDLDRFLREWVPLGLAVGPSARIELPMDEAQIRAARRKLAELPPLTP